MVNGIQAERQKIQVTERKKNNKKRGLDSASFLGKAVISPSLEHKSVSLEA